MTTKINPSVYYFHADLVREITESMAAGNDSVELSLDLNLSRNRFAIKGNRLVLDKTLEIDIKDLAPVASSRQKVFALSWDTLSPIEVRADGYYKLVPTDTVPTLEIDGIKMHRSKDIDPFVDAREKTKLVVKSGDHVLDTCGGLGYSAMFALKAGAGRVVSTEKSRAVIQIRQQNPWLTAAGGGGGGPAQMVRPKTAWLKSIWPELNLLIPISPTISASLLTRVLMRLSMIRRGLPLPRGNCTESVLRPAVPGDETKFPAFSLHGQSQKN